MHTRQAVGALIKYEAEFVGFLFRENRISGHGTGRS